MQCEDHGMKTILDLETCTELLRATFYATRDQNNNGILDKEEFVNAETPGTGTPPGCWPVTKALPDFPLPIACFNEVADSPAPCSEGFPCFCEIHRPYVVIKDNSCGFYGYYDILTMEGCRAVMNDGYYNTRDQDCNGVIDADQDYPITVVDEDATRPGCGPIPLGNPRTTVYPYAWLNTKLDSEVACSEAEPCFCYTEPL